MSDQLHPADAERARLLAIEESNAARHRPAQIVLAVLCAMIALGMGVGLCALPHEDFSPVENRTLTTRPDLSLAALADGSASASLSDFCADQLPFRQQLIELKANCELLLSKQENNGVLQGKEGYLITRQEYDEQNYADLDENMRAISLLAGALERADISFTVAIAPRSVDVNRAALPALYDPAHADAVWKRLSAMCAERDLTVHSLTLPLCQAAETGAAVWYRTDHHWTALGAYTAYAALGETLGYTPFPLSDFTPETVATDFRGTTYGTSGLYSTPAEPLTLYRYEGDTQLVTEIVEGDKVVLTLQGLYDFEMLQTHDKYSVFLGGTNAHIRVSDPNADRPTLVLLKDSFAQSLAPYLARHYDLILLDPRRQQATRPSLYDRILQADADAVLLLCGIDTLCQSASMQMLRFGLPTAKR